jgi:hypothetical protein
LDSPIAIIIIIGIAAIIIAALIGIAFGLFSTSKGTANDGVVQVQGQVGQMNMAVFQDYDQKTMVGSQVTSAINAFQNNSVAVIVKTTRGTWKNYGAIITPFGASGAAGTNGSAQIARAFGVDGSLSGGLTSARDISMWITGVTDATTRQFQSGVPYVGFRWDAGGQQYVFTRAYVEFVMYNPTRGTGTTAPAFHGFGGTPPNTTTAAGASNSFVPGAAGLGELETNVEDPVNPVALVLNGDGSVLRNDSTAEVNMVGGINYVNPTSIFRANVIRDANGDPIGVMFVQQGRHTHN